METSLSTEKRRELGSFFLLEKMITNNMTFSLLLEGDDHLLEDLLSYLMSKGLVDANDSGKYVTTSKGEASVNRFKARYQDFLKNLDVYCAVDLEEGEFAFESYMEIEDESVWDAFLNEERWEDMRVPIAIYKNLDPHEIVFMAFINEGRFNISNNGWQFDLALGSAWDEIGEVVKNAITLEDLGYEEDGAEVTGESVIRDVILQGAAVNLEIRQEEEAERRTTRRSSLGGARVSRRKSQPEPVTMDIVDAYGRDPLYVNPIWRTPLL